MKLLGGSILCVVLGSVTLLACEDDQPTTPAAASPVGPDSSAPLPSDVTNGDAGAGTDATPAGDDAGATIDCGAGKKPGIAPGGISTIFIGGGWHVYKTRGTDGKDVDPEPCDEEIGYYIVAPTLAPTAAFDDAAQKATSCAIANEEALRVYAGRITTDTGNVSCQGPKGCFAGPPADTRLLWNSQTKSGYLFAYENDKPKGTSLGTFLIEGDDFVFRPAAAGRVLRHAGIPSCTGP